MNLLLLVIAFNVEDVERLNQYSLLDFFICITTLTIITITTIITNTSILYLMRGWFTFKLLGKSKSFVFGGLSLLLLGLEEGEWLII